MLPYQRRRRWHAEVLGYESLTDISRIYRRQGPKQPESNMTASQIPSSVAERRLAIALRLFRAMVAKGADRAITLCDSRGEVVARHDLRPEEDASEIRQAARPVSERFGPF
jgi:hypothetical protein